MTTVTGLGEYLSTLGKGFELTASCRHRLKPALSGGFKSNQLSPRLGRSMNLACKGMAGKRTNGERAVEGIGERVSSFPPFWILAAVSETRRLSPTSDEREIRACLLAGPIVTLECSSERSMSTADGILPNRRVLVVFDETFTSLKMFRN